VNTPTIVCKPMGPYLVKGLADLRNSRGFECEFAVAHREVRGQDEQSVSRFSHAPWRSPCIEAASSPARCLSSR